MSVASLVDVLDSEKIMSEASRARLFGNLATGGGPPCQQQTLAGTRVVYPGNSQDVVSAAVLATNAALVGGEDLAGDRSAVAPPRAAAHDRFQRERPVLVSAGLVDRTIS